MTYNLTDLGRAGDPASVIACANELVGGIIVWGLLAVFFAIAFVKVAKWEGAASGFLQASFYTMLVSILLYAGSATLYCPIIGEETVIVCVALLVISLIVKKIAG